MKSIWPACLELWSMLLSNPDGVVNIYLFIGNMPWIYVDKPFEISLKGINALLLSFSDANLIKFIASYFSFCFFFMKFLWLWSYVCSYIVKIFQYKCGNVKVIGPLLEYVWLQYNSCISSRTFPVPLKCSLNEHVRSYWIPVPVLESHDMLSFHERPQHFHVSKVVWRTIPCIVMMTKPIITYDGLIRLSIQSLAVTRLFETSSIKHGSSWESSSSWISFRNNSSTIILKAQWFNGNFFPLKIFLTPDTTYKTYE